MNTRQLLQYVFDAQEHVEFSNSVRRRSNLDPEIQDSATAYWRNSLEVRRLALMQYRQSIRI